MKYRVTTQHETGAAEWSGEHIFRVSEYPLSDGRVFYYASARNFGCGKNFDTIEKAIRYLAADNAARVVSIAKESDQ